MKKTLLFCSSFILISCAHQEILVRNPASNMVIINEENYKCYDYTSSIVPKAGTYKGKTTTGDDCILTISDKKFHEHKTERSSNDKKWIDCSRYNTIETNYTSDKFSYDGEINEHGLGLIDIISSESQEEHPELYPKNPSEGEGTYYFSDTESQFTPWGKGLKVMLDKEGIPTITMRHSHPIFMKSVREVCHFK